MTAIAPAARRRSTFVERTVFLSVLGWGAGPVELDVASRMLKAEFTLPGRAD